MEVLFPLQDAMVRFALHVRVDNVVSKILSSTRSLSGSAFFKNRLKASRLSE